LKVLLDQNISFRVAARLSSEFPGCAQVRQFGLENRSDLEIWKFATDHDFTNVTFDADFHDLVTLFGHPPKVVWLRIGNTSTNNLITLLLHYSAVIKSCTADSNHGAVGCLEIRQV
jgi:predicted nuclease of predicted toxin-antitoxin system